MRGDFDSRVYQLVRKIPEGKVATYGQISGLIGKAKASRAVGQALKKNPRPVSIPCHRVISSNGSLGGYIFGLKEKRRLLESEGVKIKNGKIDLEKFGWKRF